MERIADCGLWIADWTPDLRIRNPKSAIRNCLPVEDRLLVRGSGRSEPKMLVRGSSGAAAARRAGQEAALHEKRLVHLFERTGILAHGGGDGREPDGPAFELLDDRLEDPAVHVVEPELIHVQPFQRLARHVGGDLATGADLGVVAHPLAQAVGDARGAAAAPRDLGDARRVGRHGPDPRRAGVGVPRPEGPKNSAWSSGSLRCFVASMAIWSDSLTLAWPTSSSRREGRSAASVTRSSGSASGVVI